MGADGLGRGLRGGRFAGVFAAVTLTLAPAMTCDSQARAAAAGETGEAARVVRELAADLLPFADAGGGNSLVSPYSVAVAMAMASAGAAGETREEMRRVLRHGGGDEEALHGSFRAAAEALRRSAEESRARAERAGGEGGPGEGVSVAVANRLFVERSRPVLPDFATFLLAHHGASPEAADFAGAPDEARGRINEWVAGETAGRIRDLIPPGGVTRETALVIANALYFKGGWETPFEKRATRPGVFRLGDGGEAAVPMMTATLYAPYSAEGGRVVVAAPYAGREFFFVIVMPEGGAAGAATAEELAALAEAPGLAAREITLVMPKFRLAPPALALGGAFRELGMRRAFDEPRGSADFSRISPKKPDDYVFISEIFHKAFLELDEDGTEAAAATAVAMMRATMIPAEPPPRVVIDRPFHFGIAHRPTGLLLFAGRCGDPR